MPPLPFTLAADAIEVIFAVLFFGVTFISWVINLFTANQAKQKVQRRGNGEGQRAEVQQELDRFLRQNDAASAPPPPRDQAEPRRPPPPAGRKPRQEQVGAGGGNAGNQGKRREKQQPQGGTGKRAGDSKKNRQQPPRTQQPQPPVAEAAAVPSRPGEQLSARHVQSSIGASVQRDLPHQVDLAVSSHLGNFNAEGTTSQGQQARADTTSRRVAPAAALVQLLRSPEGVRQAVLLNEILKRPRILDRH